jgi:hypothetical protein
MFNSSWVVAEGSCMPFFLGWEGAVYVDGWLPCCRTSSRRSSPTTTRHGRRTSNGTPLGLDCVWCTSHHSLQRWFRTRRGCLLIPRTRFDEINTTTRRWVWKFNAFPLWYFTFCPLLTISFVVRRDCGPFTYCRGLDGEAKPDVTPGDCGDIPRDGCHHQEVPCRGQLPQQPGSTTVSMVPPVVLQLRLDWLFPHGVIVLVTATLPGSFLPGEPSVTSFLEDVSAREAPLRGPAPGGSGSAPRGPRTCTSTSTSSSSMSRSTGSFLVPWPSSPVRYWSLLYVKPYTILDCIN